MATLPSNRTLFIPGKTQQSPPYEKDMQSLEIWARQPIQQLIAGSGITLSPPSGLATDSKGNGPKPITISASGGSGGGCLSPCKAVSIYVGDMTHSPPSGAATIDGYSVASGDRILLTTQLVTTDNGIWLANTAGAWSRPTDYDTGNTIVDGTIIPIAYTPGTTLYGSLWQQQEDVDVGTDSPSFGPLAGQNSWGPSLGFVGSSSHLESYNEAFTGIGWRVQTESSPYQMLGGEAVVMSSSSVTLPTSTAAYSAFIIKDSGAGTCTLVPGAGNTIDGSSSTLTFSPWQFRRVQVDGTTGHWITV